MFNKARRKLTFYYFFIIAAILILFSFGIYKGLTNELDRIAAIQKIRELQPVEVGPGYYIYEAPTDLSFIDELKVKLLIYIGIVDALILTGSTMGGYFLAGKTLAPIEEMVGEQKQFVADASHELRTPLAALKSEIEVSLRDKKMSVREAREILNSNLEEVDKIQKLTNYLLTLNKYGRDSGLSFGEVDLGEIAEKAVKSVKAIAQSKDIEIIKKLEKAKVIGNEDSLMELTMILLDNAIKYSPAGGKIIIKTSKNTLTVEDFGMGIRKKDLPHIFDRFYRADESRTKKEIDGYGLGLSIAKNIAELHSAKIKVESKLGIGSKFDVVFNS